MANEIRLGAYLSYRDSENADEFLELAEKILSITTKLHTKVKHNVGTTEEAMELGTLASLGWCLIINRDATNYVEIRAATAGTKIIKVPAGGVALFYFGSGVTAPYVIADTAACQVEYMILAP